MTFPEQNDEINILGYSGSYLALLFETLISLNFKGKVNIVKNEKEKRAPAPFEVAVNFSEVHFSEIKIPPKNGFIFCSNKPSTKKFLFDFYKKIWKISESDFFSVAHPSAIVASTVSNKGGLYLEPLSVISTYSQIGFGVTINRNSSVGHHNKIGDFCSVHPGSNLCGHVEISENVTVGAGTTIFPKVKIGKNTIIGGGSVVTKNLPENVLAFGNPCKIIKQL
jgi:sugar O-acyltransferase (sialic acid O-acetyltransferase NeuD family)